MNPGIEKLGFKKRKEGGGSRAKDSFLWLSGLAGSELACEKKLCLPRKNRMFHRSGCHLVLL